MENNNTDSQLYCVIRSEGQELTVPMTHNISEEDAKVLIPNAFYMFNRLFPAFWKLSAARLQASGYKKGFSDADLKKIYADADACWGGADDKGFLQIVKTVSEKIQNNEMMDMIELLDSDSDAYNVRLNKSKDCFEMNES